LPILTDGSLGSASIIRHEGKGTHPQRQKGPHVHGAIMNVKNDQLIVTDLGIDKVFLYSFDAKSGKLEPSSQHWIESVAGAGPRLFSFHPGNNTGYVIEELSGTVSVYDYKDNSLLFKQRISTLPPGDSSFAGSADIHVSPDGKFLYASNRGDVNTIAIFSIRKDGTLTPVGYQSTLGKAPRNFSIDPTGKFLLCENQNSDEVIIFKRNRKTGLLTDANERMTVGKPVCIKWLTIK
jgi:6-phosphogluconolactonase